MQPGIGTMLHYLSGGSKHSPSEFKGKKIAFIKADESNLVMAFEDGIAIKIYDDGQSCCENRFMRTDDDLRQLVGKTFLDLIVKESENKPIDYGDHEIVFLEIKTDDGFAVFSFHNEHNGYYGGFGLSIDVISDQTDVASQRSLK